MAFRKNCNTLQSEKLWNEAHPRPVLQARFDKRNLRTELCLKPSVKKLSQCLWGVVSKVRNRPYTNTALVKYSDAMYPISVIWGRMDFPSAVEHTMV